MSSCLISLKTAELRMPQLRRLNRHEKRVFKAKLDSITTRSYGCKHNCCRRVKNPKKTYCVLGQSYSAAQISWIVHSGFYLPPDQLTIDHICADPVWNKKSRMCKCITFAHLKRKTIQQNLAKEKCHNVIRQFWWRLYPQIKHELDVVIPGPIYVSDVTPYLSALYDATHYKPTGANRRSQDKIEKAAQDKLDWIEDREECPHKDGLCLMMFGEIPNPETTYFQKLKY